MRLRPSTIRAVHPEAMSRPGPGSGMKRIVRRTNIESAGPVCDVTLMGVTSETDPPVRAVEEVNVNAPWRQPEAATETISPRLVVTRTVVDPTVQGAA